MEEFAGTETERVQRNSATNITILSGDIDNNDSQTPIITDLTSITGNSTNSYHVVTGADGAILDGFTITAGYADGSGGGGIVNVSTSPILTNVIFSGNIAANGGGIFIEGGNPKLTNVTIRNNSANHGGGLWGQGGNPVLTDVIFIGNTAIFDGGGINYGGGHTTWSNLAFSGNSAGSHGGGMYNRGTLTLVNATFYGNTADYGGGMENGNGSLTLTNITLSNNSADFGGGLYNNSDFWMFIKNTIFWGNIASNEHQIYNTHGIINLSDSIMQGGCHAGINCTNIISTDPLLGVLGNYGGFAQSIPILVGSSGIDAGNNDTCAATDQRGISRPSRGKM